MMTEFSFGWTIPLRHMSRNWIHVCRAFNHRNKKPRVTLEQSWSLQLTVFNSPFIFRFYYFNINFLKPSILPDTMFPKLMYTTDVEFKADSKQSNSFNCSTSEWEHQWKTQAVVLHAEPFSCVEWPWRNWVSEKQLLSSLSRTSSVHVGIENGTAWHLSGCAGITPGALQRLLCFQATMFANGKREGKWGRTWVISRRGGCTHHTHWNREDKKRETSPAFLESLLSRLSPP